LLRDGQITRPFPLSILSPGFTANKFGAIQAEGPGRIARLAVEAGIHRMVHVSAIGADADSDSAYARSKAEGEAQVLRHQPEAVILRPSIIFGPEDQFFNRFAGMARLGPFLPVAGAETRFQPVYVDDVALVAERAVLGQVAGGIYELGGPQVATFRELMQMMLDEIRRRRIVVNLPMVVARLMAFGFDMLQIVSFGVIRNGVLTRDQLRNLAHDNVVAEGALKFADLGITPTAMEAILPDYLWRFRPSGQYAEIKESARNLRP
jgi:uncharacterized protein YbjT (DUF2867 family)